MRQFNLGSAWSKGIAFISEQAVNQAIILIGMGILLPTVLQFAVGGAVTGMNPMMMGQNVFGGGESVAALAGTMIVVMIVSYILQMGSYFSSWRIGLGRDETLGGAIVYGIICAVLALLAFVVLGVVAAVIMAQAMQGGPAIMVLMLLVAIPVLIFMAALYSVLVAAFALGTFLMLLIFLAFGSSMGAANPALAMTGAGGLGLLIALVLTALLFWLTARLSCTTSVLADRKSFNLFGAIAESWRLTGPSQLRIMAYLALLGIILGVVLIVAMMILGASMMGGLSGGEVAAVGIGAMIAMLVIGIPIAYVTALVPAGIYREVSEETAVAEVFA